MSAFSAPAREVQEFHLHEYLDAQPVTVVSLLSHCWG
jgi:hypothetical protein